LSKITNRDVPIISSTAHAVDTSSDLGVMVDSRLTLADQVAATVSVVELTTSFGSCVPSPGLFHQKPRKQ